MIVAKFFLLGDGCGDGTSRWHLASDYWPDVLHIYVAAQASRPGPDPTVFRGDTSMGRKRCYKNNSRNARKKEILHSSPSLKIPASAPLVSLPRMTDSQEVTGPLFFEVAAGGISNFGGEPFIPPGFLLSIP